MGLKNSLEFLKNYVARECAENSRWHDKSVAATLDIICERIQHAIDHVITDHCNEEE